MYEEESRISSFKLFCSYLRSDVIVEVLLESREG